jgi:hypothetical protein
VVRDASGQSIACVYSRETEAEATQANVLTKDEARRIAANVRGCRSCWVGASGGRKLRQAAALVSVRGIVN